MAEVGSDIQSVRRGNRAGRGTLVIRVQIASRKNGIALTAFAVHAQAASTREDLTECAAACCSCISNDKVRYYSASPSPTPCLLEQPAFVAVCTGQTPRFQSNNHHLQLGSIGGCPPGRSPWYTLHRDLSWIYLKPSSKNLPPAASEHLAWSVPGSPGITTR